MLQLSIQLVAQKTHYVNCHFLLAQKVTIPIDREALFAKKLFLLLFSGKSNQNLVAPKTPY
jgi:hypothetical protein